MLERRLTEQDVAERYNVTLRTVRSWVHQGIISHIKIGRKTFFSRAQIEDFERRGTREAVGS